jgi:hypothetical protein
MSCLWKRLQIFLMLFLHGGLILKVLLFSFILDFTSDWLTSKSIEKSKILWIHRCIWHGTLCNFWFYERHLRYEVKSLMNWLFTSYDDCTIDVYFGKSSSVGKDPNWEFWVCHYCSSLSPNWWVSVFTGIIALCKFNLIAGNVGHSCLAMFA